MSARRFSLLLILMPVLFASKCRKDKEVEDDGEGIEIAPPEVSLQVTAVEPDRPEANKGFRATIYGSAFSDGAEVWIGNDAMNTVVFRDETSIRFGPDTTITLDDFEYTPEEKNYLLQSGVTKGLAVVVTGAIAKAEPDTVAVTTPKGTIGIRGTKFSIKVED